MPKSHRTTWKKDRRSGAAATSVEGVAGVACPRLVLLLLPVVLVVLAAQAAAAEWPEGQTAAKVTVAARATEAAATGDGATKTAGAAVPP